MGHAIVREDNRRPLTWEARVHAQVSESGICDGQRGTFNVNLSFVFDWKGFKVWFH
jgi:hypothetical protein